MHAKSPHLHLGTAQLSTNTVLSNKQHVPTGRIALEQVVESLIGEHGVEPLCDDWRQRLAINRGLFELHRSWSSTGPMDAPPGRTER